jgi:16S rRNA processing protein RimM
VERNRVYLKLAEITDRDEADEWRGAEVEIAGTDLPPLEEGEYYAFELIGLTVVTTEGEELGVLEEVLDMPANDVYVVRKDGKEYLIPAIKEVIQEVDLSAGQMVIQVIEGMLD